MVLVPVVPGEDLLGTEEDDHHRQISGGIVRQAARQLCQDADPACVVIGTG